jgi:prophage regulatory protein
MKPSKLVLSHSNSPADAASTRQNVVFLRRIAVEAITGLSRSAIYAQMAAGTFPKNVLIGTKGVRWVQAEILSWCNAKIEQRK